MRADFIKTYETKQGTFSSYAEDEYIGLAMAVDGVYSPGECELMTKLIKPGDIVVEGGSNVGAITLTLARAVGSDGEVHAFEPQQDNYELLTRNMIDNDLTWVTCHHAALGASPGNTTIPHLSEMGVKNFCVCEIGTGTQAVPLHTIDTMLAGKKVALIKLDVEGCEADALRGARAIIEKHRPLIYCENERPDKYDELQRLVRGHKYRLYHHYSKVAPPDGLARQPGGQYLRDVLSRNMLCVPAERTSEYSAILDELGPIIPASAGRSGWAGIARLGGIGDNLIAASVLRPLKAAGYKVEVITSEPNGCVFENNPHIDKLSFKGPADVPANPLEFQAWFRSRSNEYDTFAHLSHTCEASLALQPIQSQFQWPSSARRKYFGHNYLEFVHDVVGMPYMLGPLFYPTDEEREQALFTRKRAIDRGGSAPVIGWALNGSRLDKVYSAAPIAIARLIKELGVQIVMFGAPPPYRDFDCAKQIQDYVRDANGSDNGLHLALSPNANDPSWPLRRSLTQLFYCDLVIGPDTGQMWAVAFERMPKIVLHSHASVQNITKHWLNTISLHANERLVPCWPCHLLHDVVDTCLYEQRRHGLKPGNAEKGAACINNISVEDIVGAARKALTHG